jgi:hypothetical protein
MDTEKLVSGGPKFVEVEFEKWSAEPHKCLLPERGLSKRDLAWRSFLLGYFYQKAGGSCSHENERENLFKQSLTNYQSFQHTGHSKKTDIHYFAQWQIGSLQKSLRYPWAVAEESHLKAMEYNVERGEAHRDIIIYYCLQQNWPVAYIYSSYCLTHFLGNIPSKGNWFVNTPFYKWKILKYHMSVLLQLGELEQFKECAQELFGHCSTDPDLSAAEKQEISVLKASWRELL